MKTWVKLGIVVAIAAALGIGGWFMFGPKTPPKPVEKPAPTKVEPKPKPKVAPKVTPKPTPQKPAPAPEKAKKVKKVKKAPAKVDCETVRWAIRTFSPEHLEHLRKEYGITPEQEREYRKCR